jgi:hypothetical protein
MGVNSEGAVAKANENLPGKDVSTLADSAPVPGAGAGSEVPLHPQAASNTATGQTAETGQEDTLIAPLSENLAEIPDPASEVYSYFPIDFQKASFLDTEATLTDGTGTVLHAMFSAEVPFMTEVKELLDKSIFSNRVYHNLIITMIISKFSFFFEIKRKYKGLFGFDMIDHETKATNTLYKLLVSYFAWLKKSNQVFTTVKYSTDLFLELVGETNIRMTGPGNTSFNVMATTIEVLKDIHSSDTIPYTSSGMRIWFEIFTRAYYAPLLMEHIHQLLLQTPIKVLEKDPLLYAKNVRNEYAWVAIDTINPNSLILVDEQEFASQYEVPVATIATLQNIGFDENTDKDTAFKTFIEQLQLVRRSANINFADPSVIFTFTQSDIDMIQQPFFNVYELFVEKLAALKKTTTDATAIAAGILKIPAQITISWATLTTVVGLRAWDATKTVAQTTHDFLVGQGLQDAISGAQRFITILGFGSVAAILIYFTNGSPVLAALGFMAAVFIGKFAF